MDVLTQGVIETWASDTIGWWDVRKVDIDLDIGTPEGKNIRRVSLHRLVKEGKLEKHPHREGMYRYKRKDIKRLNPNADSKNTVPINWPRDIETEESFGLSNIKIFPKSIIILAGVSNQCKTTVMLNTLVENMDTSECVYMTNELGDEEFVDRMDKFDWVNCRNGNGEWKFEAIEHFENYQDIIEQFPDAMIFIDYLDPGENPYQIGIIIDQIRQKSNGVVFIAIQKRVSKWTDKQGVTKFSYADYGTGGQYSEHRARLVLHLDPYDDPSAPFLLTIKKSKSALTGKRFKFNVFQGAKIHGIVEL